MVHYNQPCVGVGSGVHNIWRVFAVLGGLLPTLLGVGLPKIFDGGDILTDEAVPHLI